MPSKHKGSKKRSKRRLHYKTTTQNSGNNLESPVEDVSTPSNPRPNEKEESTGAPVVQSTKNSAEQTCNKTIDSSTNILRIIEKVIKCLKTDGSDLIPILASFLNMLESSGEKKETTKKLISTLLLYSENGTVEEMKDINKSIKEIILPEELRSLAVNNEDLKKDFFLGEGGFGMVCCGILRKNNTTIRVAYKESIRDDDVVLKHEAVIMSTLEHPNVVKILGIIRQPFRIIMEYLPNGTLTEALLSKIYSNEDISRSILEIVEGMVYISSKNIVHRDLAVRNIFVDRDYHCKVGDFGFSQYVDSTEEYLEKFEDVVTGHSAPEVLTAKHYTTKSDVYSMGFLLWEMHMVAGRQHNEYLDPDLFWFEIVEHPYRSILKNFHATEQLTKPNRMNSDLYTFIRNGLLHKVPELRPTFPELKEVIPNMLK